MIVRTQERSRRTVTELNSGCLQRVRWGMFGEEGVEEIWADIWLGSLRGTLRSQAEASEAIVENMSRGVMQ